MIFEETWRNKSDAAEAARTDLKDTIRDLHPEDKIEVLREVRDFANDLAQKIDDENVEKGTPER